MFLIQASFRQLQETFGLDWKGLGYIVSIVSVLLLGAVAWPTATEPAWHQPVLIAGMATSILGMCFRYLSHLQQQRKIKRAEAEARHANGDSAAAPHHG
jgi:hypothetical protein